MEKIYALRVDDGLGGYISSVVNISEKKLPTQGGAAAKPPPLLGWYILMVGIYNRKDIPTQPVVDPEWVYMFIDICDRKDTNPLAVRSINPSLLASGKHASVRVSIVVL